MVKTKPFVIEYNSSRVLMGCEFVDLEGNVFKSIKAMKDAEKECKVKMNPIVFCPACGVGHRHDTWRFPLTPNKQRASTHKGQCPNCGERLSLKYNYDIERATVVSSSNHNEPITVSTVRGKSGARFPSQLKWWPVEDDKLAIETVTDLYFSRTMYGKYWLKHEVLRYRYIFNLKTGQLYMMRGVDADGNPSKHSCQTRRLQNYTFAYLNTVPFDMNKDFVEVVLNALHEHKGVNYTVEMEQSHKDAKEERIYICSGHRIGLNTLGWLNYFSDMKSADVGDMLEMVNQSVPTSTKRTFKKLISLSQAGEVEWLPKYMKKRSIRRRLNKRVISFFLYRWMHACGICDVNIMNTIVDYYIDTYTDKTKGWCLGFDSNRTLSISDVVRCWCLNPTPESIGFVRWAIKGRNAESVCQFIKSIFTPGDFLYTDSVRMYENLPKKSLPSNTGNIKELHDSLVVVDRKLRYGNREIEYTDVEKSLEKDCGEFYFRLPKDTDTLYDIGKALGICVGSYSNDAANKRCTIVTMSKNDKYVACIELRVHKKNAQMVQLKSRFNHTVSEIEPVTEWVTVTGVNAKCADYQNAVEHKRNGFDERDCDYHVENPRLNEPRRHRRNEEFVPNLDFEDDDIPFGAHIFPF